MSTAVRNNDYPHYAETGASCRYSKLRPPYSLQRARRRRAKLSALSEKELPVIWNYAHCDDAREYYFLCDWIRTEIQKTHRDVTIDRETLISAIDLLKKSPGNRSVRAKARRITVWLESLIEQHDHY